MSQTLTVDTRSACHSCPDHHHAEVQDDSDSFISSKDLKFAISILEKISLVALAVFAAYIKTRLFFTFFGAGVVMGVYGRLTKPQLTRGKVPNCYDHEEGGGCSQGFLEQLTGVRLPPLVGLAANVAIMYCHIEHHTKIFVPLISLNFGNKVGDMLVGALGECEAPQLAPDPNLSLMYI